MRKFLSITLCLILLVSLCSCTKTMPFEGEELALVLTDDSGAGRTDIVINKDGTFKGTYMNVNPDDVDTDYPKGTVTKCEFTGEFSKIKKLNDYSYKLTTEGVNLGDIVGSSWIENGIQYVSAAARGIEDCKEFILYLPGAPTKNLSMEFLSWCHYPVAATLPGYGLLNTDLMYGFFEAK